MTREEIITALKICIDETTDCTTCPYDCGNIGGCTDLLLADCLTHIIEAQPPQGSQDAAEMPEPWSREKVLSDAKKNVCGQREHDYGSPEDSFKRIAALWQAYKGVEFTAVDAAVMLGLLKVARIANNPAHMDNWVDLAGYAACGGEIAGAAK